MIFHSAAIPPPVPVMSIRLKRLRRGLPVVRRAVCTLARYFRRFLRTQAGKPGSFSTLPQGPCVSTDTACSSSLLAAHLALGQMRLDPGGPHGTASLAGGVNIMLLAQTTARICLLQARPAPRPCSRARCVALRTCSGNTGPISATFL